MKQESPLATRIFAGVLMVATIAGCIWFYATPWTMGERRMMAYRSLQLLSFLIPLAFALDIPWCLKQVRQTTYRTNDTILGTSVNIVTMLLLLTLSILLYLRVLPPRFLPWLLPVALFLSPFVVVAGHGPLRKGQTNAILKFAIIAVVGGGSTWLQLALVSHFKTWLFLMVGITPIPLLAITTGITGIAAFFSVLVLVCAAVFHPLRLSFGIRG